MILMSYLRTRFAPHHSWGTRTQPAEDASIPRPTGPEGQPQMFSKCAIRNLFFVPRPLKLKDVKKDPEQRIEGNFGVKVYIPQRPVIPRKIIPCDVVLEPLRSTLAFSTCVCMKGAPLF